MRAHYLLSATRRSLSERGLNGTILLARKYVGDRWFALDIDQTEHRFRLSQRLHDLFSGTVAYGPFRGLKLADANWWGAADRGSMLLGLYEQEVLEWLSAHHGDRRFLIDIGAADGYYAVGSLVAGWVDHVYCFEQSEEGRHAIAANAKANGVADRVTILGTADESSVEGLLLDAAIDPADTLMIVDIEGGEFELLTTHLLSRLAGVAAVVEIHDWESPDPRAVQRLAESAGDSFQVGFLRTGSRDPSGFPELKHWPDDDRWLLCSESRRQVMQWMILEPRIQ